MDLHPFVQDMKNNVYVKRRNVTAAVAGPVGSGKSYTALAIACFMDKKLKKCKTEEEVYQWLEKRAIRDPSQLNKLLNEEKLKFGDVIIFDEAGTSADSRRWWDYKNEVLRYNMQIFRNKRLVSLFTLPNLTFLDKQARNLIEFYIETINVDFNDKRVYSRVRKLQTNPHSGDVFKKRPIYITKGRKIKVNFLKWPKPPDIVCKAYEDYAEKFKNRIRAELQEKGQKLQKETEEKEKPFDPNEYADEWLKNNPDAEKPPTVSNLFLDYQLSQTKTRQIRTLIQRKLHKSQVKA